MTPDVRSLLHRVLALLRRAGDAPLQSGIDGAGFVRAAWKETPRDDVSHSLSTIVFESLFDATLEPSRPIPLAEWVERFYAALRPVDPRAVEILSLRVEGMTVREIAERLGGGERLIRRILDDMHAALREGLA